VLRGASPEAPGTRRNEDVSFIIFFAGFFIGGAMSFVVTFDYFTKGPKP
jgi:hypothetical protein